MNFSIHLTDDLAKEITVIAKKSGKTRNSLITQAIRDFINVHSHKNWPQEVYKLAGAAKKIKPFESNRKELKPLTEVNLK